MADDNAVIPVPSPWRNTLLESLKQVHQSLFMICPYIKDDVITAMKDALLAREIPSHFEMRVITRALPDDFLSGSSDIAALQHLLTWPNKLPGSSMEIRIINNVHAKVWLFDTELAIVGSGNATSSGLGSNLEYGLAVADPSLVARIQQDWQSWWEQATPTNAEELGQMRQWLEKLSGSEAFRQLEVETKEKRRALERVIGAAPRIGKRLQLARRESQPEPHMRVTESPALYIPATGPELPLPLPTLQELPVEAHTTIEYLSVCADELWQALFWTFPLLDEEFARLRSRKVSNSSTFLKLAWVPASSERHYLQCIWADGKRYSQATIAAHHTRVQSPWAITLSGDQIMALGAFLQKTGVGSPESKKEPDLNLSLQTSPCQVSLVRYDSPFDDAHPHTMAIPCVIASTPGSFPVLRPPVSQITLENAALVEKLTILERAWYELQERDHSQRLPFVPDQWKHPFEKEQYPLSVVEFRIHTPGKLSSITLSTGSLESNITDVVAVYDCVLAGPPITFRFDFVALWQVLVGAAGKVHRWNIIVDRDANVAQFSSDPPIPDDATLLWRHQLWNVIG